jgi:hypothetical protein
MQLIEQIKMKAIPTFKAAHPGCQALFIYPFSSKVPLQAQSN